MFRAIFFTFIVVIACIAGTVVVTQGPLAADGDAAWIAVAAVWGVGLAVLVGALVRRRLRG